MTNLPTYSIVITTFVYRLETYYKPLMNAICRMRPDIDKVVFVNGQHKKEFDQGYRREIMRFSSLCPKTYLVMSPIMRGCSFMWNTGFNFTNSEYILTLSDDIMVTDGFFDHYEAMLRDRAEKGHESFRVNYSFAHFSIYRPDLFDVGYFDERLLGFGEEDGDWLWRYEAKRGRTMPIYQTNALLHACDRASTNSENMVGHSGSKYSRFNREWMFGCKYDHESKSIDPSRPHPSGMFSRPLQMYPNAVNLDLYPAEKWYRDNIHKV
jgi:hypothetical protein